MEMKRIENKCIMNKTKGKTKKKENLHSIFRLMTLFLIIIFFTVRYRYKC